MIFRRTLFSALLVGLLAGLVLTLAQVVSVNPIIFAAEAFEIEQAHDHASHDHTDEAWAPQDGAERTGYTVVANIFAGIGFAAMLLAVMSQVQMQGLTRLTVLKGLVWGTGGFLAFFVAPGLGLPPEIPGIEAAPVEHRQTWWLFAVVCVAAGLIVLSFAAVKLKGLGVVLLALPYLVDIPHAAGPAFAHPDAQTVEALTQLHQQFIVASGISNFAFWLALGVFSAWILNAWVLRGVLPDGDSGDPVSI